MFGITFVGHPTSPSSTCPGEFEGHPLRKDFPLLARHVKPWPGIVDVEPMPADEDDGDAAREGGPNDRHLRSPEAGLRERAGGRCRVNLEFETDEGMTLNMGPQHPATHGTLRIVVKLDGEQVVSCEPIMGYMHRGYEKLTEVRTYPQVTTLVNRIDWLGSFANEVPFILAAEKLMDIEAPPRAQWIRTMLFELSRIANITCSWATWPAHRCHDRGVLRLPRPRVRAQPDRGGHRRSLPPQLRPHRRPQGRPAQGLDRRHQGRHGQGPRLLRRDGDPRRGQRDLPGPHPRHRGHPRRRRHGLRPLGREPAASGVDWDLRRDSAGRPRLGPARLEGLDPPRRRLVRPLLGAPPGDPRSHQDGRPALRRPAQRPDHGQGAPHHQGARGRGLGGHREPARRDGLLRGLQGRPRPVPGQDPHRVVQQHLVVPWVTRGVYVPDVVTILASLYFILGDIDR
jgi:NADH-quinone oxidoreductase subunit D